MFIPEVFAAGAAGGASSVGASFANFIPLILIVVVFYFFIIRPHNKRLKGLRKMVDQVKCGDIVATSGGIIGTVNKVDEANTQFIVEIAPKVEIKVLKSAISEVLNKEAQAGPSEKGKVHKVNKRNKNQPDKSKKGKDNKSKNA